MVRAPTDECPERALGGFNHPSVDGFNAVSFFPTVILHEPASNVNGCARCISRGILTLQLHIIVRHLLEHTQVLLAGGWASLVIRILIRRSDHPNTSLFC